MTIGEYVIVLMYAYTHVFGHELIVIWMEVNTGKSIGKFLLAHTSFGYQEAEGTPVCRT